MRLVSLCPSITETLFELGVGGAVVGATKFCVEPEAELAGVDRIGGTKDPDLDRIAALEPTLVLMNEEENRREDSLELEEAGLNLHSSFPKDPEGTAAMVRSIAETVGRT
ncbi:MAG: helical backbone metal receptor, partial [Planctomycetota bacterium]